MCGYAHTYTHTSNLTFETLPLEHAGHIKSNCGELASCAEERVSGALLYDNWTKFMIFLRKMVPLPIEAVLILFAESSFPLLPISYPEKISLSWRVFPY